MKDIIIWKPKISVTSNARSIFNTRPSWVSVFKLKNSSEFPSLLKRKKKSEVQRSRELKRGEGREMRGEKNNCI